MQKQNSLTQVTTTMWTKMSLFIIIWIAIIFFLSFRLYTQTTAKPPVVGSSIPLLDPDKFENLRISLTDRFRPKPYLPVVTGRQEPFD